MIAFARWMRSTPARRVATPMAMLAAAWLAAGTAGAAERDVGEARMLGDYLAGRVARGANDTVSAVQFYRRALTGGSNGVLTEPAFLMEMSEGNWAEARALAATVTATVPEHRLARLFLGVEAFKRGDLAAADRELKLASGGPIGELTGTLARAWVKLAAGDAAGAVEMLEPTNQAEWAQFYMRYHKALIADIAGRRAEARTAYDRLFKADSRTLRIALAYARHAAAAGDLRQARSIIKEHLDRGSSEPHPLARALRDELTDGATLPLLVRTPEQGLAEVLYGLGEAVTTEGVVSMGAIYLQLALHLAPGSPEALSALANVYEQMKRHEDAIATYGRIKHGGPLQPLIEIRKAINLNLMERVDEAVDLLERSIEADPSDLRPLDVLGNILRSQKRYEDAIRVYDRIISLIPKPEKKHWVHWYARGTCYERIKVWSKAEADLLKALQLYPDQPQVLNYLGYSWIDQNMHLKRGLALIEKAVSLKPDDGYIVDSLGWAHYKLENFKDAVRYLERAVELRPEDPVLNDHLGDALWRVGREREARFQWEQALELKPEPEDIEKIRAKLEQGLPPIRAVKVPRRAKEASKPEAGAKKRVESKSDPQQSPFYQ